MSVVIVLMNACNAVHITLLFMHPRHRMARLDFDHDTMIFKWVGHTHARTHTHRQEAITAAAR